MSVLSDFAHGSKDGDSADCGLLNAALLIAAAIKQGTPTNEWDSKLSDVAGHGRESIDEIAGQIRCALDDDAPVACQFSAVLEMLFSPDSTHRFRGNSDDYYAPSNSSLIDLFGCKVGNPITLSVLTISVGRQLGVDVDGVGMPAHFLVRNRNAPTMWGDPYHHGRVLNQPDARELFHSVTQNRLPFREQYLEAIPTHRILLRMLTNLYMSYASDRDAPNLQWVAAMSAVLPGAQRAATAKAATDLADMGRHDLAALTLEAAAEFADTAEQEKLLDDATGHWARLN